MNKFQSLIDTLGACSTDVSVSIFKALPDNHKNAIANALAAEKKKNKEKVQHKKKVKKTYPFQYNDGIPYDVLQSANEILSQYKSGKIPANRLHGRDCIYFRVGYRYRLLKIKGEYILLSREDADRYY